MLHAMPSEQRRSFVRYLGWQAPGWLVAAAVLFWLHEAFGLTTWLTVVAFAAYVGKDLALYPAMRAVFRAPAPSVPIGRRATAVNHLAPTGLVRVDGELWNARVRGGEVWAAPGSLRPRRPSDVEPSCGDESGKIISRCGARNDRL
jgi:hypothetical protein